MHHTRSCLALIASITVGCADLEPEDQLGETASELSTTSWSAPVPLGSSDLGSTPATVNGTTVIVRSECCDANGGDKDLAWAKRTGAGTFTPWVVISGQTSRLRPSLAGFNGYIYMLRWNIYHQVRIARFDPSTSTWSQGSLLPYQSGTMPAIVAFQNKLWIFGNSPDTYQIWSATMTTTEVFSQAQYIDGKYTSGPPSAAVFANRLYLAHQQLATDNIIYARFDGTTWTPNQFIFAGPNGAPIIGTQPVLAAVNGFLHIVYRHYYDSPVRWSYFDTCVWSPEVSIGALTTAFGWGLSQGGPGLILTTRVSTGGISESEFTAPPAPILPPTCSVANP